MTERVVFDDPVRELATSSQWPTWKLQGDESSFIEVSKMESEPLRQL